MRRSPALPAGRQNLFRSSQGGSRRVSAEIGEIVRKRAQAEAAIAEARRAHARLRDPIDILPQGIVFLDAEGRYILWNRQYADIYRGSADLFEPGARLEDTCASVSRAATTRKRPAAKRDGSPNESRVSTTRRGPRAALADGRGVLIEERRTSDGGLIGLRIDITEIKQRDASFRRLFDANPVRCLSARSRHRILAVNDAAVAHYGYSREGIRKAYDPQAAGV